MSKEFSVTIREMSKDMSAKEKIMLKDTSNAVSLDALTAEQGNVVIDYAYHAILDVHNEHSDNTDYTNVVVVDKAGTKYVTGSETFIRNLVDIVDEMATAGEADNIQLEVFRKESNNYKGKTFITVSLI